MRRAALALLALTLTGCGADVNAGTVTDRYFSPSYVWFMNSCSGSGSSFRCILIPITEPDRYVLTLTNCVQRVNPDDDCPSERHYVDPDTYDRTQLGDELDLED